MTHSVDADASSAFAWEYWVNVANWSDPPAEFRLDGPFAAGSRGTTLVPGQEPLDWIIREVSPPRSARIDMELPGATASFEWQFEPLDRARTRLTQRVVLQGTGADAFVAKAKSFATTIPEGMSKLALAMAEAAPKHKSSTQESQLTNNDA